MLYMLRLVRRTRISWVRTTANVQQEYRLGLFGETCAGSENRSKAQLQQSDTDYRIAALSVSIANRLFLSVIPCTTALFNRRMR